MSISSLGRLAKRCPVGALGNPAAGLAATLVVVATLRLASRSAQTLARPGTASHAVADAQGGLVIWFDTGGRGEAGRRGFNLEFTNLGGHACKVAGFPEFRPSASRGSTSRARGSADHSRHNPGGATCTGGDGDFGRVQLTDTGNFPSANCHQVLAAASRLCAGIDRVDG